MKNLIVKIAIIVTMLVLTACSPHTMMDHPSVSSEEVFIAEMIPHHQEAVDSSRLMLSSENPKVKALAEAIILAQELEISMMQDWMGQWYADSDYKITYKNMMPELTSLEGEAKDKAYLEGMIAHHKGAIEMAKQAQTLDFRAEVLELTKNIILTQEDEIKQINAILKGL